MLAGPQGEHTAIIGDDPLSGEAGYAKWMLDFAFDGLGIFAHSRARSRMGNQLLTAPGGCNSYASCWEEQFEPPFHPLRGSRLLLFAFSLMR